MAAEPLSCVLTDHSGLGGCDCWWRGGGRRGTGPSGDQPRPPAVSVSLNTTGRRAAEGPWRQPSSRPDCSLLCHGCSSVTLWVYVMCHQQNQFYSVRKSHGRSNKRLHQTLYPLDLALSCAEPGPTHDWENQKFALSLSIMLNINLQCAQTAGKMKDKIGHTFY